VLIILNRYKGNYTKALVAFRLTAVKPVNDIVIVDKLHLITFLKKYRTTGKDYMVTNAKYAFFFKKYYK